MVSTRFVLDPGKGTSQVKRLCILVPFDFSPASDVALEMATSLARDSQGSLILAHVEDMQLSAGQGKCLPDDSETAADSLAVRFNAVALPDSSVPVERRLLTGSPADAILNLARAEHVDMIVIGTDGRRGLSRLLMGSVAESVVRTAPCPVLTVKPPVHATQT